MKDINFALVEETRPPIYRAMKYWGKKPHNIWHEYIKNFTPDSGIYFDPFAGSCISTIESIRAKKKTISFDLNPLSSFFIKFYLSEFNEKLFNEEFNKIDKSIKEDPIYNFFFDSTCPKCQKKSIAQHYKIDNDKIYEIGVICKCKKKLFLKKPDQFDNKKFIEQKDISIDCFYPTNKFPKSESFNENFIDGIGGNNFSYIWPKRNLYVIAKIFDLIKKIKNDSIKIQLLSGFIQTIHLCTKMCPPRREAANRAFSTSWGRSAYLCPARQFHSNPLYVFNSSCIGRQSVRSALKSADTYLSKKNLKIIEVNKGSKNKDAKNFDLKFGIVDIQNINDYLEEKSVDFIMTDPPYGGLVKYFNLSYLWLCWLKEIDDIYIPNFNAEITIDKEISNIETYKKRFQKGIENLLNVLKDNGKIVFTFHNKDLEIWNAFLKSITSSGLKIEKVLHQENARSGESAVAMPYGTSSSDFYIRCVKGQSKKLNTDIEKFKNFIIYKSIEIIASRNEKTPYQFLFNGLLPEISTAGYDLDKFDGTIEKILSEQINKIFKLSSNKENKSGDYWWLVEPEKYIKYPDKKLQDRVEDTILSLLRRKISITFNEALAEIFVTYPNGLTPDTRSFDSVLKKYATKSGGKWIYRARDYEKDCTDHTETIFQLIKIGKKLAYKIYVGKREQHEIYHNKKLVLYCDFKHLKDFKDYNKNQLNRLEQIDLLWIKDNKIKFSFEIENTTKFISGIQRGSNLDKYIPKIMIMPNKRKAEFLRNKDPLFLDQFKNYNWTYAFYSDVVKFEQSKNKNLNSFNLILKKR